MSTLLRTALVLAALAGGVLAALAGSPRPPLAADEVEAVELAGWIRARRPGLLVLDARAAGPAARDRVPGARPLHGVDAAALDASAIVVVYADRHVDEAVAGTLRARSKVLRLHGGIEAWNTGVLFPTLRADATSAQRRAFARRAQLSRYFGGVPRVLDAGAVPERTRSRQGC